MSVTLINNTGRGLFFADAYGQRFFGATVENVMDAVDAYGEHFDLRAVSIIVHDAAEVDPNSFIPRKAVA